MKCAITIFGTLALLFAGCGSSQEGGRMTSSGSMLMADEIARSGALTAYEAVQSLRPEFLRRQGPKAVLSNPRSTVFPAVYLNGAYYGELESLKSLFASDVREIHFIEAKQATIMFGTGHSAGVIMVNTKSH